MAVDCNLMKRYYDTVSDKKLFDLHIKIMKHTLTRSVIEAYLKDKSGWLRHMQPQLRLVYMSMTDKDKEKFQWILPFYEKPVEEMEPDITRLLHDPNLQKYLKSFIKFALQHYKCSA